MAAPACRSNSPQSAPGSAPVGLSFTGRRPDGQEIALSNRTKWSIQPAGSSATLRWQPGEPVQLGSSGVPMWPAAITSRASGATAFARPAGRF
jgi:hypothetical protein